ncbi:MAG TPA: LLM class flavin-dependent oxidoreductase [Microlunatus sp.]|nr:LLM class flavin-dependent oxidoreductase [Microlunatus sp.]
MVAVSISVEGMMGLTWPFWKRLVSHVEQLGFAGLYRSDHFTLPIPVDLDSLEMIVSLAYAAEHTSDIPIGSLVAPLSFRDPVMLARQAAAIDDLSGGRLILGMGAGWEEREHEMFGYTLGDTPTRFERLVEGVEVVSRLLRSGEPVSYTGRYFNLRDALLLPRPERAGGPPIMIGGSGPKRTLPVVARFADIWNAQLVSPSQFRDRSNRLDELILAEGRRPTDVRRTVLFFAVISRDSAELERRLAWARRRIPPFAPMPLEVLTQTMREALNAFVGTPDEVVEQIGAFAAAGAEEVVLQWPGVDDLEGLQMLAEEVLPACARQ